MAHVDSDGFESFDFSEVELSLNDLIFEINNHEQTASTSNGFKTSNPITFNDSTDAKSNLDDIISSLENIKYKPEEKQTVSSFRYLKFFFEYFIYVVVNSSYFLVDLASYLKDLSKFYLVKSFVGLRNFALKLKYVDYKGYLDLVRSNINRVSALFVKKEGKEKADLFYVFDNSKVKDWLKLDYDFSSFGQVFAKNSLKVLRPALIFGLTLLIAFPINSMLAYADETATTDVVSTDATIDASGATDPATTDPAADPAATTSPDGAIETGTEVIVEPTPTDSPSPEATPTDSPSPEATPTDTSSPEATPTDCPTSAPVEGSEVIPCPSPSPTLIPVVNPPSSFGYQLQVEGVKLTWNKTDSEIDKYVIKVDPEARQIELPSDVTELLLPELNRKATYTFSIWAMKDEISSEVSTLTIDLSTLKFPRPPMNAEVGGLIVKFEDSPLTSSEVTQIADNTQLIPVNLEVSSEIATDTHLVEFTQPVNVVTANEIADALEASDKVAYAELDFAFVTAADETTTDTSTSFVPNDPLYATKQWPMWGSFGIGIANGPTGLALAYQNSTGLGLVVAVIDTGFTNHPDLEGQFVSGYDFVSNNEMLSGAREENGTPVPYDGDYVDQATYGPIGWDDNPLDPGDWRNGNNSSWHGTHIAGLIAAKTNNGIGIAGIAPDAKIQPIRAFSWRGGLLSDVIASITWASGGTVENVPANQTPAKVLNLSFSIEAPCTPSLQQAIDEAINRGSVVVAAAGNNNADAANYAPGNCQNVITVGAINSDGNKANYSNYGAAVDISAPGGEIEGQAIYSTSNEGTTNPTNPAYTVKQGTSIATAQVSAAIAKLAQQYPQDNAVQLRAKVLSKESTKPFTSGNCTTNYCGIGYLFFGISVGPYPLNNLKLRFGTGTENSVNSKGLLQQPFYKSVISPYPFYKLTYSSYPLNFAIGTGTGGTHWTGNTAIVDLASSSALTNPTTGLATGPDIDYTGYISAGGKTYGIVTSKGRTTINGKLFELTNTYSLGQNDSFVKITSKIKNVSGGSVSRVNLWTGTQDDWVGSTDRPQKQKGSLATGSFVAITNAATPANALQITSGREGVLFYSTKDGVNMSINSCCSFANSYNQNPTSSAITLTNDGSYAMYVPVGDLANNQEFSFDWFYAAGATGDLATVAAAVSAAGAPAVPTTSAGNNSLTVTWDPVTPPDGSTLVRYEIECDPNCNSVETVPGELIDDPTGLHPGDDGYTETFGPPTTTTTVRANPYPGTTSTSQLFNRLVNSTSYRFRVRAITSSGTPAVETAGSWSGYSIATNPGTPRNLTAPTIDGSIAVGRTLNANDGTWESGIAGETIGVTGFSYLWQSCLNPCLSYSDIATATSSTYVIQGDDVDKKFKVKVIATNSISRTAYAYSPPTSVYVPASPLQNLTSSEGSLVPEFNNEDVEYALNLDNSITSVSFTASFLTGATARVNGVSVSDDVASSPILLNEGLNVITISVTSASGSVSLTINVIRASLPSLDGATRPTPSPTPIPSPTSTLNSIRRNLIINPFTIQPTIPILPIIPGTINRPEPLVQRLIQDLNNSLRPIVVDLFNLNNMNNSNVTAIPNPNSTSSFNNERALALVNNSQNKEVSQLPSLVLVDNQYQESRLVIVDNTSAQIVTPSGGLLNVQAKDGNSPIPVNKDGRVQMVRNNNVETNGTGMQPNSEFAVYLFSEPTLLGIGKTDASGNFFATFPVKKDLPIGDHTLQVNGLLADGKTTSISVPVTLVDSVITAKNQAMPKPQYVAVNPLDKALKALYWMLVVLAVMIFLITTANRKRFFALFRRRRDDEEELQTI